MRVTQKRYVMRPLTRRWALVAFFFCFASFPGIGFLSSGYGQVLPWASLVFLILVTLHAGIIALTVLLLICEKPITIYRQFRDPNYCEHEL
jgi:hypothetical protein